MLNTSNKFQFFSAIASSDITVLNTRPRDLASPLTQSLIENNINVVEAPFIEINPLAHQKESLIKTLTSIDYLIFISRNAVNYFFDLLSKHTSSNFISTLATDVKVAAIGLSTAQAYQKKFNQGVDISPKTTEDSEGLLACNDFQQLEGKEILIVRGVGGREFLSDSLLARGANCNYLEVYQRSLPNYNEKILVNLFSNYQFKAILIYSSESLSNLLQLVNLELRKAILLLPLVVIHPKIKQKAIDLGFEGGIEVIKSSNTNDLIKYIQYTGNH